MKLPATISDIGHLDLHHESAARPNFVTRKIVTGRVVTSKCLFSTDLRDSIIVVESADPGWDWLFSNKIAGLITCYGGANSHMAIRAAELSLPAAIGVGETKFRWCSTLSVLQLTFAQQIVRVAKNSQRELLRMTFKVTLTSVYFYVDPGRGFPILARLYYNQPP